MSTVTIFDSSFFCANPTHRLGLKKREGTKEAIQLLLLHIKPLIQFIKVLHVKVLVWQLANLKQLYKITVDSRTKSKLLTSFVILHHIPRPLLVSGPVLNRESEERKREIDFI